MIGEWQVHVAFDFILDSDRVHIWRRLADGTCEIVTGFDEFARPVFARVDPHVQLDHPGLLLPRGVVDALARVARPGPSEAEMGVLRESLDVERRRVDRALGWITGDEATR